MKKTLLSLVAIVALACSSNAQTNLLTNGTFDSIEGPLTGRTANEWGTYSGNGGTGSVISGVATISPVASADNWQMQLEQWNYVVENGKTYTVSFDAWADTNRVITLTMEDPAHSYALLGTTPDPGTVAGRSKWNVNITTTQTKYQLTITVDGMVAGTTPKFAFLMAQTAAKVYIDNVSLVEVNSMTTYLDFEGLYPAPLSTFGGSDYAVVANPLKAGVNTSDHVVKTQKGAGAQTWGGMNYDLGGTINFAPGDSTFTIDVLTDSLGSFGFHIELGAQGTVELRLEYTTPGVWQTLSAVLPGRNKDYSRIAIFPAFFGTDTDVWYWDNLKGPGFIPGAPVDVTLNLTDLGGAMTSAEVELSNSPGTKIALTNTAGIWSKVLTGATGSTIIAPIWYTVYINGAADPAITDLPWIMAGSAPATIAKNVGKPLPGAELITNGVFDGIEGLVPSTFSGKEWGMYSGNGGVAEVVSGVATVSPAAAPNELWQMQLIQQNFYLENGKSFTASFDAWSAADRIIQLSIEDPSNGYAQLGATSDAGAINGRSKWDVSISTVQTKYTRTLKVDKMKANTLTKFVFILAQTADVVYIDNVSLVQLPDVSIAEIDKVTPSFYFDAVGNNLRFPGETSLRKVVVYNVLGTPVKEFNKVVSQSLSVSDLKTGVYVIRTIDNNGKFSSSKFIKK